MLPSNPFDVREHGKYRGSSTFADPIKGLLVPLRTKAELQAHDETVDIYVVEVPLKDIGPVLSAIRAIPKQDNINVHHLRRVAKDGYLPENLIRMKNGIAATRTQTAYGEVSLSIKPEAATTSASKPVDDGSDHTIEASPLQHSALETVYVFLAPTSIINNADLYAHLHSRVPKLFLLSQNPTSTDRPTTLTEPDDVEQLVTQSALPEDIIFTLPVPAYAPTSLIHAAAQSAKLWPTTYNPNTTYGPNPSIIASAQAEIEDSTAAYIALARHAGYLAYNSGAGQAVGAAIVERTEDGIERIVAVAGDRRWANCDTALKGNGDPSKHAVMRAIDFVARKRRAMLDRADTALSDAGPIAEVQALDELEAPHHLPSRQVIGQLDELDILEKPCLDSTTNLAPNGYLCLNLEVYTSHEPCVMCSMALVHSRVGRVIFGRRMPKTGGLTAELDSSTDDPEAVAGLGYGLFWRESLNWRFLCWEWRHEEQNELEDEEGNSRSDRDMVANGIHA